MENFREINELIGERAKGIRKFVNLQISKGIA